MQPPAAPALDECPLATAVPEPLPKLEGYTFMGYRNADGSVGTKNILGISTTVQCVAATVDYAVKRIKAELLPKYPNVDDVVAIDHHYGCGVAIDAPGAAIPIRTLRNLALNPNFGGEILLVSLGCEKLQPARMIPAERADLFLNKSLQSACCRMQRTALAKWWPTSCPKREARLKKLNERRRVPCPASELIVGVQCGGSDAFSGVTANPAVGFAADLLVRAGATVMFSEVTEVRDAAHLITARAATPEIAKDFIREMAWYDNYLAGGGADRQANPSPGNKQGGLTNVVEKAMGSVAKSGTHRSNGRCAAGRAGNAEGAAVCGHARQRLCLRHPAAGGRHECSCVHYRPRNALRFGGCAGDQSGYQQRTGRALARPDRR